MLHTVIPAPAPIVLWKRDLRASTQAAIEFGLLLSLAVLGAMVILIVRKYQAGAIATFFDALPYACVLIPNVVFVCVAGVEYLRIGERVQADPDRHVLIFERCARSDIAFPPYVIRREAAYDEVAWVSYHGPIHTRRGPDLERVVVRLGSGGILINGGHGSGLQQVAESIARTTGAALRSGPEPKEHVSGVLIVLLATALGGLAIFLALRGQFPAPTPPSQTPAPPPAAPAPAP
jgi:hypothetical protein